MSAPSPSESPKPTVFVDTPKDARIIKEVFGPVVNINTFEEEAEVVAKANDTEFGLYSAVFPLKNLYNQV